MNFCFRGASTVRVSGLTRHRRGRPPAIQHMVNAKVTLRYRKYRGNFPCGNSSSSNSLDAPCTSSSSSRSCCAGLHRRRRQIRVIQPFNDAHFLNGVALTGLIKISFTIFITGDKRLNSFRIQSGGDRRAADFRSFSTSSSSSIGSRISRSSLFIRSGPGVSQTALPSAYEVLSSTPFAASIFIEPAVHRRQGTVGIFEEKSSCPKGVQRIHQTVVIRELHHRGGDRDYYAVFHLHPVRFCMLAGATAFTPYRQSEIACPNSSTFRYEIGLPASGEK